MRLRRLVCSSLFLLGFAIAGCGGAPSDDAAQVDGTDEELKAKAPIPYVLQWVGKYDGDGAGDVDWVVMRKTGTFAAKIGGVTKTGRFVGPSKPGQWPLVVVFITNGDSFKGTISQWSNASGNAVMKIAHHGVTETATAPWKSGGESMCDDTNGSWADDDADPATGLFCVCNAPEKWIPSQGGCVR
jgi:hypothetical protein